MNLISSVIEKRSANKQLIFVNRHVKAQVFFLQNQTTLLLSSYVDRKRLAITQGSVIMATVGILSFPRRRESIGFKLIGSSLRGDDVIWL